MDMKIIDTMQQRINVSIRRSAMLVLSRSLNRRLDPYFPTSTLIIVFMTIHALLNTIRTIPGFNESWRMIRDLMQSIAIINSLATYIASNSGSESNDVTAALNLILFLAMVECVPIAGGWIGEDIDSLTTSLTFIFSDRFTTLISGLHVPLLGAALSLCLEGHGLLGRMLAFSGVNILSSLVFDAVIGGELSLAWPLTLLYFIHEIHAKYDMETLLNFGIFKTSDIIYNSLTARKFSPGTIFIAFVFLAALSPEDSIWYGVCVLIFVHGGSESFTGQLETISTADPVLAVLSLITVTHLINNVIENSKSMRRTPK
jgi:hypothetical protein